MTFIILEVHFYTNCTIFPQNELTKQETMNLTILVLIGKNHVYSLTAKGDVFFYFCDDGIAVSMKHNIERHFQANHSSSEANYPLKSKLRK
jgi:hypothetical protein